jgi:hypothetical protein
MEVTMSELKKGEQRGSGRTANIGQPSSEEASGSGEGEDLQGRTRSTQGTNRDFDETNQSRNQGHGHPREERG